MGRSRNQQQGGHRARGSVTRPPPSGTSSKGVEVVSEENFERRKQACADCQRHRSMGSKQAGPPPGHRATPAKQPRSITVHLRDSNKTRHSKRAQHTEALAEDDACEDEDYVDRGRRVASLHQLWNNQVAEKYGVMQSPSFILHSGNKLLSSREEKNFNAFLSAIEKVHLKDHKNILHGANVNLLGGGSASSSSSDSHEHAVLKTVLNNSTLNLHHDPLPSSSSLDSSLDTKATGKLQLICNDLHNPKSRPDTPDTISSLDGDSSISSSSSCSAGSTSSSESHEDLTDSEDMSREEVERLAQYTTGCPLTKYSCPPHECPECIRAYYKHYYASSSSSSSASSRTASSSSLPSSSSSSPSSSVVASRTQSEAEEEDSEEEELEERVSTVQQQVPVKRVEVSVAACLQYTKSKPQNHHTSTRTRHRRHRSSRQPQPIPSPPMLPLLPPPISYYCPDTVSIDLTNSDVEFSVYYHPKSSDTSQESPKHRHNHHHHHHHHHHHQSATEYYYSGNFCSTMPPPPPAWSPYYLGGLWYPPVQPPMPVAIPRPLCVPTDTKCLKSQCLCLVPASEIKDCKYRTRRILFLSFFPKLSPFALEYTEQGNSVIHILTRQTVDSNQLIKYKYRTRNN